MCCFSRSVRHVAKTKIFGRALGDAAQALVYSMTFSADGDVAMLLPLPTPPGASEDAVRFLDLSAYPRFFDDLDAGFPVSGFAPQSLPRLRPAAVLKVHRVGSFEASFVPRAADFTRLDPRFRLPPALLEAAPRYADWGFAVFKLSASAEPSDVHPMAFTFPSRDARIVYFPTLHVHDGAVHPTAHFDHQLYAQAKVQAPSPWWSTGIPAARHVDLARAQGLVGPDAPVVRLELRGQHRNDDVLIWA